MNPAIIHWEALEGKCRVKPAAPGVSGGGPYQYKVIAVWTEKNVLWCALMTDLGQTNTAMFTHLEFEPAPMGLP